MLWLRDDPRSARQGGASAKAQAELFALAQEAGVGVERVERARFERACGPDARTQGTALRAGPLPELTLESLLRAAIETTAAAGSRERRLLLALDGVEDPQNLGAIARVAESAGVGGLILTHRRAPPLSATVSRASAGAIEWLPVARVQNLARALDELRAGGFWVVAAEPRGGQSLFAMEDRLFEGDLVVVLGSEGKGLRPNVLAASDHRVAIPMRGRVASLNVATAGAVLLYDLVRRSEAREVGGA